MINFLPRNALKGRLRKKAKSKTAAFFCGYLPHAVRGRRLTKRKVCRVLTLTELLVKTNFLAIRIGKSLQEHLFASVLINRDALCTPAVPLPSSCSSKHAKGVLGTIQKVRIASTSSDDNQVLHFKLLSVFKA